MVAHGLGHQAVLMGLESLDVARIHEQTLATLTSPDCSSKSRQRKTEQARRFFAETVVPIEETHRAALNGGVRANELTRSVLRRTAESCASARCLKQSILLRRGAQKKLKKSGKRHAMLLAELRRMQKHLRLLTRGILSAQERTRQRTSRQLHDEIAQTLIAINLRLLALKTMAKASTATLKKKVANTQRMVRESARRIGRWAHEFRIQHEV